MPQWHALSVTSAGPGVLRVLQTACQVAPAFNPTDPNPPPWSQFNAIWDTGATGSVITDAVVNQCGLLPIGMTQVLGVHGTQPSEVYLINLGLPNGVKFPNVRVTKGQLAGGGIDVLIGMDVITVGDFSITNVGAKTVFSFRIPSQTHVDYVQEHARLSALEASNVGAIPQAGGRKPRTKKKPKTFGRNKRRKH